MLRFNTFRSERYLRSKFVEGKYLLASEATDLELEVLDLLRKVVNSTIGDVAIEDAFKVQRLSDTQLLIAPGQAWFRGLPFSMRGGKDQLVTGAVLSLGTVPVGTTATDDSTGLGKVVTFNSGSTTPTNLYRLVITAREELITEVDDPFLQNVNLTESTAQKIRLNFQLNIVPESLQSEAPIPYRDESSASGSVTNFPNSGGMSAPNYINQIHITGSGAGNGELIALNPISGSEGIDGRDLEAVIRNNPGLGGGNPIPNSPSAQQAFSNGKLIDSYGNKYHINAVFNDTVSTQVVLRIDKEPDQPNPQFVNGLPFTLIKREVYVTDDSNGAPQGRLHWPIATVDWNSSLGLVHDSVVTDLRAVVLDNENFQDKFQRAINLIPTGGGSVSFGVAGDSLLEWNDDVTVLNSFGPSSVLEANTLALIEDGAAIYDLDFESGGIVSKGNLAVTILSGGSTITVGALDDLSEVRLGNIIRIGSEIAQITYIDDVSKQLDVTPSITGTGAATIYLDSFANDTYKVNSNSYVFAVRKNGKVWIGGGALELEDGETSQIGDGVSEELLTYIGAPSETDSTPSYSSADIVTQGGSLTQAIGELDASLQDVYDALAEPLYDERILYPSGLAASTNIIIPVNSRDSGNPHFYDVGTGDMIVFVNQLIKFPGIDYNEIDNQTIAFVFDLPTNAEVRFRDAVLGAGTAGGGGGGGSLQDAYNVGETITTSGTPFTVGGSAPKVAQFNGDIGVTGVIDPLGIEFEPTGANPLGSGKPGFWVNMSDELVYEDGTSGKNITQAIENLESGVGVSALSRLMFNNTGSMIPKGTPVYSPSPGEIAPARGTVDAEARVIGIAAANIPDSTNGLVAFSGMLTGVAGYTHGSYVYLGDTAGELVDVEPTLGPYSSGFNVVIIGVVENNNIMLQIHHVGVL